MAKELTPIDKFGKCVELIKNQIVTNTKLVTRMIRNLKHAKSENDRKALLNQISERRRYIECYRLALDDLTYAFVKYRPEYGKKIVSRFGYQTTEGYLADKQNGVMPSLREIMELITTGSYYITSAYKYSYDEEGRRVLTRNFSTFEKAGLYRPGEQRELLFSSGDPTKDVHDTKQVAGIVSSGSRHR